MIKPRTKNYSGRPEVDVGDILGLVGCKIDTRKLLVLKKTHVSLPTTWEFIYFYIINYKCNLDKWPKLCSTFFRNSYTRLCPVFKKKLLNFIVAKDFNQKPCEFGLGSELFSRMKSFNRILFLFR